MNKLTAAAKEEASLIVADMPHTAVVILAEKDLRRSFNARNLPKCALILAARERIAKEATEVKPNINNSVTALVLEGVASVNDFVRGMNA